MYSEEKTGSPLGGQLPQPLLVQSVIAGCSSFIAFLISLFAEDEEGITSALLMISNSCFKVFYGVQ